jgi:hypothetical protein
MCIDDVLARVLHVIAVMAWIGGVWFVTWVVLPAVEKNSPPDERLAAFHRIEAGFAPIARLWVLLAGVSGLWMVWRADMGALCRSPLLVDAGDGRSVANIRADAFCPRTAVLASPNGPIKLPGGRFCAAEDYASGALAGGRGHGFGGGRGQSRAV